MPIVVRWTSEAKQTFQSNIAYLRQEWSQKEIDAFISKVELV
jgi:hypothetical protein